ncbi:hypothetical protein SK854_45840 [Lentzea sp. BCCO 10_0061]|uniref:DUF3558 domain-containing protein n=1 Tax=Lentzea sokolovensis TaxID=3095429 RepID=A0ABU4VCI0_9PSEU|nr:hypothetical protein [Lentzea sp. BCCO 10_0061]MDX8149513.1 hypothetical protein [Lentzea sp. BCCO 10_0061]
MRTRFAAALTAFMLMAVAACGTDVPAGLADKVKSGCPDLLKPEPLAVITKGFVVSEVNSVETNGCQVFVSTGRKALNVGIVAYASAEESERLTPMLCTDGKLDAETKACTAGTVDGETYSLHAVAGRWNVRVSVFEVPVTDEVKDAVQQIVEDLRSSDKTRG